MALSLDEMPSKHQSPLLTVFLMTTLYINLDQLKQISFYSWYLTLNMTTTEDVKMWIYHLRLRYITWICPNVDSFRWNCSLSLLHIYRMYILRIQNNLTQFDSGQVALQKSWGENVEITIKANKVTYHQLQSLRWIFISRDLINVFKLDCFTSLSEHHMVSGWKA